MSEIASKVADFSQSASQSITYGFQLFIRVHDASGLELVAEVIGRDDIAGDAGERAGGPADEEPLPRDGGPDDLARAHGPPFPLLPLDRVEDLLVHGHGHGIRRVSVRVGLRHRRARPLEVSLVDQPARRLWATVRVNGLIIIIF